MGSGSSIGIATRIRMSSAQLNPDACATAAGRIRNRKHSQLVDTPYCLPYQFTAIEKIVISIVVDPDLPMSLNARRWIVYTGFQSDGIGISSIKRPVTIAEQSVSTVITG